MLKHILIDNLNVDIDKHLEGISDDCLVVIHDFYQTKTSFNYIKWSEFRVTYSEYESKSIVLVGLNRMRTSQSRYDLIYSYLYVINKYKDKVVIDNKPFNGEPWRSWYAQSFVNSSFLGNTNSFPIQGEYNRWFLRDTNFCRLQEINLYIDNLHTELSPLKTKFIFHEPSKEQNEIYQNIKKIIFDKYNTPRLLIRNILKQSNKQFHINIDFDTYLSNGEIELLDLPIYKFVSEENNKRLIIYNNFTNGNF